MDIAFTNLGSSANPDINDSANASSYSNSSWTPPTSGLIIAFVCSAQTGGLATPTMSGNSLTWTNIATVSYSSIPNRRITLFAADASGATTGATTVDFGGNNQIHCMVSFFQVTGVDLSGGVTAAFVQQPTNNGSGASGSVTLSAAGAAGNRPIACFEHKENEATTFRTDWTEVDDLSGSAAVRGMDSQYRDDAFETTASASWSTSSDWGGIAAELKAEVAAAAAGFMTTNRGFWGP